jgi:hypothetical protein
MSVEEAKKTILLILGQKGPMNSIEALRSALGWRKERVYDLLKEMCADEQIVKLKGKTGKGFVVESEEFRLRRVKACIDESDHWATETELAVAADVQSSYVKELLGKGIITRAATGKGARGFIFVNRAL